MTRFCPDAKPSRSGGSSALTGKDLKKRMEVFKKTGVHPDIAAAQQRAQQGSSALVPLPPHDANRDFIFLDLGLGQQQPRPLGRLVVELYTDMIPVRGAGGCTRARCHPHARAHVHAARCHPHAPASHTPPLQMGANHLRNRVLPGSAAGLRGACAHKLQAGYAVWLGKRWAAHTHGAAAPAALPLALACAQPPSQPHPLALACARVLRATVHPAHAAPPARPAPPQPRSQRGHVPAAAPAAQARGRGRRVHLTQW